MPPWKADEHWTDFECLAAIWSYYQTEKRHREKESTITAVMRLTGRSEHAVVKKMGNVAAFDRSPGKDGNVKEWKHGQKKLERLLEETDGGRLITLESLERGVALDSFGLFADGHVPAAKRGEDFFVEEGAWERCSGKRRKRSEELRDEARKHYRSLSEDGILRCCCCKAGFGDVNGREIIQIHHLKPISYYPGSVSLSLEEALRNTVPLCPTCHALAHTRRPPLEPETVARLVRGERPSSISMSPSTSSLV